MFGLLDWSAVSELGYQKNRHGWRLGYQRNQLELTGETGQSPYGAWDFAINDRFTVGLMAALGLQDASHYAELSVRVRI